LPLDDAIRTPLNGSPLRISFNNSPLQLDDIRSDNLLDLEVFDGNISDLALQHDSTEFGNFNNTGLIIFISFLKKINPFSMKGTCEKRRCDDCEQPDEGNSKKSKSDDNDAFETCE
jgi:hypothetical protein